MVEVVLPCSPVCPLLVDVGAAVVVTLVQVKVNLQRLAPAKQTQILLYCTYLQHLHSYGQV